MSEIFLDPDQGATLPDGFIQVETEADFLRQVSSEKSLLVRGEKLCNWAEIFYRGRGIQCQEVHSLIKELKVICPALSDDQAQALAHRIEQKRSSLHFTLRTQTILQVLYPSSIWVEPPTLQHAASWLLWLCQPNEENYIYPLLAQIGDWWYEEADSSFREVYKVRVHEQAIHMLEDWLGIGKREDAPVQEVFPLDVPIDFQKRASHLWLKQIIESHGSYFDQLESWKIPFVLKKIAAKETCRYFINHSDELSSPRLDQLSVYLSQAELNQLRKYLAPAELLGLPKEPDAVLGWYRDNYLPYREWQHYSGAQQGKQEVLKAAREFALWYLDLYPQAIAGSSFRKYISFSKVNGLKSEDSGLVLLIVLDGLHALDARFLLQCIRTHTQRLTLISDNFTFAPLPTVTQFAKEALFRGVSPNKIQEVEPLGEILPEDKSPANKLARARGNGLYLWRVQEPDRTYHQKNKSENLRQDIEGRLEAEALKIKEIIEAVPDTVKMKIVITTDHGRMLGKAKRIIDVPEGMEGHSRAVWGVSNKLFSKEGYLVEGNLVYLFGESFGLHEDTLIPLDESAFRDSKGNTGSEVYPHGGMFPEEVVIPWIIFARDYVKPDIEIFVSGEGTARKNGMLEIRIINKSDINIILEELIISYQGGREQRLSPNLAFDACLDLTKKLELIPWPSSSDVKSASAMVMLRQPNQLLFEYPSITSINSDDMYENKAENILEDLE